MTDADRRTRFLDGIDRRPGQGPKGDCHAWSKTRTIVDCRYGNIEQNGRQVQAHRLHWMIMCGPIPRGKLVLHRCDWPPCVRLEHLFLGTQKDNMADMVQKGARYSVPHLAKPSDHESRPPRPPREVRCACGCGRRFTPTRPHHRYFAPSCRARSYLARQIERRARHLVEQMKKESR